MTWVELWYEEDENWKLLTIPECGMLLSIGCCVVVFWRQMSGWGLDAVRKHKE